MTKNRIKENLVYKKDLVLKSSSDTELQEHEYLFSKTVYNEEGKVLQELQYNAQGEIQQEYVYKYDAQGFLKEEILKEADGFIAGHRTFERNEKGLILKEFRHYMDESYDTIHYHYDEQGNVVKKETIDPDDDLESIEEFGYNAEKLTLSKLKDAEGDILSEKTMKYDEKGNLTELEDFDASVGENLKVVNTYHASGNKKESLTYNGSGQLIEKVELKEDSKGNIIQVIEETHHKKNTINFSFDEDGNMIYQEEFDRNGEMVGKVKREYGPDNTLLGSHVFIHGAGRGLSRNYSLRQQYTYFSQE